MKGKPITAEQAAEIIQHYRRVTSGPQVAESFGLNPSTVWRVLLRHGVKLRRRGGRKGHGVCVDCQKRIDASRLRCEFHAKARHAELQREYYHERMGR